MSRVEKYYSPLYSSNRFFWTLLVLFVVFAVSADLFWASKKSYFATYTCSFKNFTLLHPVPTSGWYNTGGSGQEDLSLPYMAILRFFHAFIRDRLVSLRVVSVIFACLSLFFLYRLAAILFNRSISLLFLFLLATSPIYIESMRAFGYQSLSHLVVVAACYLMAATLNNRKIFVKLLLLAVCCVLTMSLYVGVRVVIALPIIFFALYPKKGWSKLLIFLFFFVGLVLLLEASFGAPPLNFKEYFIVPQEPQAIWIIDGGKVSWPLFRDHLLYNLQLARGYLLNLGREPFADRDTASRLFNGAYLPFLIIGFVICCWRRKQSNLFLLLMLLLFFVIPMGSREIQPRRILCSLYPLYLMIALGLRFVYQFLERLVSERAGRSILIGLSLAGLFLIGGHDLHEFIFQVAKPGCRLPVAQLEKVAEFVTEQRGEVGHIRYNKRLDSLIMGNPCFIRQPEADYEVANIFGEEDRGVSVSLKWFAAGVGEDLLCIYPIPEPPGYGEAIGWARKYFPELCTESVIAGTGLRYALFGFGSISPNIIFRESEKLKISHPSNFALVEAGLIPESGDERLEIENLIDGRQETSWDISLGPGVEETRLIFDFGENNAQSIKSLVFRPSRDRPEQLFHRADLTGSDDGVEWGFITSWKREEGPVSPGWREWDFPNGRDYRYYKLDIYPVTGKPGERIISIGDLLFFEDRTRRFRVEDIL